MSIQIVNDTKYIILCSISASECQTCISPTDMLCVVLKVFGPIYSCEHYQLHRQL